MKKLLIILISVLTCTFNLQANKNEEIIPNASYVVCDNYDPFGRSYIMGIYSKDKKIRYDYTIAKIYTFDGNFITTKKIKTDDIFKAIKEIIDPKAHKPRPVKFKIIYNSGKGHEGYYILFYDKNNNIINSFPYKEKNKFPDKSFLATLVYKYIDLHTMRHCQERIGDVLDLSIITQEYDKPWYKFW